MSETTTKTGNDEGQSETSIRGIRQELGVLFGDKDWLTNLHAKAVGAGQFAVLSARNGTPSEHIVDLRNRSCTCEDFRHNRQGEAVCAHIAYCILRDDDDEQLDHQLLSYVAFTASRVADEAKRLTRAATGHEADHQAEQADDSNSAGNGSQPDVDPGDAARKLDKAMYAADAAINYELSNGKIWVQSSERWDQDRFNKYFRDADQMNYDPDATDSPGEYYKNYIAPSDVDAYISEVVQG